MPKHLAPIVERIIAYVDRCLDDYCREMKGIAKEFGIPLGVVIATNFGYEFRRVVHHRKIREIFVKFDTSFLQLGPGHANITGDDKYEPKACTSIVAQDVAGRIFHGRNLDWDIPS